MKEMLCSEILGGTYFSVYFPSSVGVGLVVLNLTLDWIVLHCGSTSSA